MDYRNRSCFMTSKQSTGSNARDFGIGIPCYQRHSNLIEGAGGERRVGGASSGTEGALSAPTVWEGAPKVTCMVPTQGLGSKISFADICRGAVGALAVATTWRCVSGAARSSFEHQVKGKPHIVEWGEAYPQDVGVAMLILTTPAGRVLCNATRRRGVKPFPQRRKGARPCCS
jgi:hypothetical protein